MILDTDQQVKCQIDKIELSHDILKELGWTVKYNTRDETTFEHNITKGTTILLRHFHHYLGSGYYTLWWSDKYDIYNSRVTNVGQLNYKLNQLTSNSKS